MIVSQKKVAPPNDDRRWKLVDATMRRYGNRPRALIESLHTVQDAFGYIDEESLRYVAASLQVSASKAYGVATFYNTFTMKPPGEMTLVVCLGTACYVKGSGQIVEFCKQEYGIGVDETTSDGKLALVAARCVGACGMAPVIIMDGEVVGKLSVDEMKQKIREWMSNGNS